MTSNVVQLPQNPKSDASISTDPVDELADFAISKTKFEQLLQTWDTEIKQTSKNRLTRDLEFSVDVLRTDGTLDEDETIIPIRVIDTNIQRELPPYVNYIMNSRRLSTFRSLSVPGTNTDNIEQEYTSGMTYCGWQNAHYKVLDGSSTHGWDACEVTFDASKSLHVAVEQVGHDRLFWPRTCLKLEQAQYILRAYDYAPSELRSFITKYGWEADEVNKLLASHEKTSKSAETLRVFKALYKRAGDGVIMVGWFSIGQGSGDWLKKPKSLYLGIDKKTTDANGTVTWSPVPITQYPYFLLPYRESEKPNLTDRKGRVFLDGNKQEAETGIWSAYINGMQRASHLRASPKQDDGTGNSVSNDQVHNIGGAIIIDKPMDYYYLPYPDSSCLNAVEQMDNQNAAETNQVNFAVNNRQDSRKTAKEIETANNQASMLNSVQLTLFSTYFREVYSFAWLIVQSQALQGLIKFLQIPNPVAAQDPTQPQMVNDFGTIGQLYELRAAGDVDVVQRQELLQQMKQDWAVFQNTPLGPTFLEDLIRLAYPAKAEQYITILRQGNAQQAQQSQALIKGLGMALQGAIKDDPSMMSKLPPDQQQHLQQMIQAANAIPAPNQPPSPPSK